MKYTIAFAFFALLLGTAPICSAQFAKSTTSSSSPLRNINRTPQRKIVSPLADGSLIEFDHGGTFFDVRLKTKPWVVPHLMVSTKPLVLKSNLQLQNPQDVEHESRGGNPTGQATTARLTAIDLKADTDYHYVLFFEQLGGPFKPKVGKFRTLKRHVSVQVNRLYICDDSDELSCGDLTFTYQLFNGSQDHRGTGTSQDYLTYPEAGFLSLHSGDFYHPGTLLEGNNVEEKIKIAISVLDDDSFELPTTFDRRGRNVPDEFLGTGCDEYSEWNSIVATINLGHKTYITPPSALDGPAPSNWLLNYETKSENLQLFIIESEHSDLEIVCEVTYFMWYE